MIFQPKRCNAYGLVARSKPCNISLNYEIYNERKSGQAHIPQAQTLLESVAHNECQCHVLVMGHRTESHNRIFVIHIII